MSWKRIYWKSLKWHHAMRHLKDIFVLWLKQMLTKSGRLCSLSRAIYVWSLDNFHSLVKPIFGTFIDEFQAQSIHTQKGKTIPIITGTVVVSFVFAYHTCISQWSQFSVLHPLNWYVEFMGHCVNGSVL